MTDDKTTDRAERAPPAGNPARSGERREMMSYRDELRATGACAEAVAWVGERTAAQAWAECERADWLLWEARRRGAAENLLIRAAATCARRVLRHVPPGENCPRLAVEAAEAVAVAIETGGDVKTARAAAREAASAAWAAESAEAAESAAWAESAARAAWMAASAAWTAAARGRSAAAAAWAEHRAMCAIIREIIPAPA